VLPVVQDHSGRALGSSQRHSDEQGELPSGKHGTRYASRPEDLDITHVDASGDTTQNNAILNAQSSSNAPVNKQPHASRASPMKNFRRSIFDRITGYIRSS